MLKSDIAIELGRLMPARRAERHRWPVISLRRPSSRNHRKSYWRQEAARYRDGTEEWRRWRQAPKPAHGAACLALRVTITGESAELPSDCGVRPPGDGL